MNRRLIGVAVAVLAVVGLGVMLAAGVRTSPDSAAAADQTQTQPRDDPAPPLRGTTLDGTGFDLTALHGQVVLVNVWASWCDPCRQELPALAAAQRRWSADGFRVVGIDMRDNLESAHRLLTEVGASDLTSVADPQGTLAVAWGARGVPESFLVDRAGRVRWWTQGAVDAAWLEQRVPALLAS
ncbi:TlpA disulfide reductase family protein [Actinoplanes sp. NPDC026619]|uniref:TlpA family protein disulfide reductase n=1 Tax=Actinoplanes sp. NPDC026619 TaxID=3155798 RepID=UPI0033F71EC5